MDPMDPTEVPQRWHVEDVVARMTEMAWAAGVIDVRGEIRAVPRKSLGTYTPVISVRANYDTDRDELCQRLYRALGGTITRPRGLKHRWQVQGAANCVQVIDHVLPYLSVRRKRAVALRRLCVVICDYKRTTFEGRGLPLEEMMVRQALYDTLRQTAIPR